MNVYKIFLTQRAQKDITKLPSFVQSKLNETFSKLSTNPFLGKALSGDLKEKYSYRMGDYRIVYEIHKKEIVVIIVTIGHRQHVYRNN